jgi:hypothetical protein
MQLTQYGSTVNFRGREKKHRKLLERCRLDGAAHMRNADLQDAYNAQGALVFQILDEMPGATISELRAAEQAYIDKYRGREWCLNKANACGFTSEQAQQASRNQSIEVKRAGGRNQPIEVKRAAGRKAAAAANAKLTPAERRDNTSKAGRIGGRARCAAKGQRVYSDLMLAALREGPVNKETAASLGLSPVQLCTATKYLRLRKGHNITRSGPHGSSVYTLNE